MEYLIKAAAVLTLFYIVYKVFLEQETYFQSIRMYLLAGLLSSLLLPRVKIKEYVYVESVEILQNTMGPAGTDELVQGSTFGLLEVITWIYLSGVVFFAMRFLFQLVSLYLFLKNRPKRKEGPYWMMPSSENTAPFSFFRYIVYPHNRFKEAELEQVLAHEKAHSDQFHSLDILLSELVCVFIWFNPLAWMYHKEIQKNLEYIADSDPKIARTTTKSYEFLLLKTAQPSHRLALASSFYQSLIKKRIQMLQKSKSNNIMYLKLAIILPVMAIFVMNFNTELVAQTKKASTEVIEIEEEVMVIDKDFSKGDLEDLKADLLKQGIDLSYKKLKYNDAKEIIGIELVVSNNKGNKATLSQSGDDPINPISIRFDPKSGSLALGNMSSMHEKHVWVSKDGHDGVHKEIRKEIIIDKDGKKEVIVIGGDGSEHLTHEDIEIDVMGDGNVWVSKSGDSTVMKHVKVIQLDEDSDSEGPMKIMIKKGEPGSKEIKVEVKTLSDDEGENEFFFISDGDDDEKPLIIMDGKEVPDGNMNDLDKDKIETIEVLKGDKAVEKYGEKARNGVVIIKSKK